MPNLAALHEAIAAAIPEHECLVFGERRLTWRSITDRTRRLAAVLASAGLGCHRTRAGLANHESGQDHVALYLYNGNEYLEGMLGAMKARCAPFNVNYRRRRGAALPLRQRRRDGGRLPRELRADPRATPRPMLLYCRRD